MVQTNDLAIAERYGKYVLFKGTSSSDISHYFYFPEKYAGSLLRCKNIHITFGASQSSSLRMYSVNSLQTTCYISASADTIPEEYAQCDIFVPGKGYARIEIPGATTVAIGILAEVC